MTYDGSMRPVWKVVSVVVLVATGCAPQFQTRLPDAPAVPAPLVVMPLLAGATEVEFSGDRIDHPEWTKAIAKHAVPEIQRLAAEMGGFSLPVERLKQCGEPCVELFAELAEWGHTASMEIAAQMNHRSDYGRTSVGHWQSKRPYGALRREWQADYVLFVVISDIYESLTKVVGNVIGGTHTSFKQVGVACVANLVDGRMIWCHAEVDRGLDLRTPAGARGMVRMLLSDLVLRPGSPAPVGRPVSSQPRTF